MNVIQFVRDPLLSPLLADNFGVGLKLLKLTNKFLPIHENRVADTVASKALHQIYSSSSPDTKQAFKGASVHNGCLHLG